MFGGRVCQQAIGIPMGTNYPPLLADLFLHAYEADFLRELRENKYRKLVQTNLQFQLPLYRRFPVTEQFLIDSVIILIAKIQM